MAADSGGHHVPLQLEPFVHQVGGHSSMFQLDEDTICKPLIPQELNFYKNIPNCLKEFVPQFKGVTKVTFTEDVDSYLNVVAHLPSTYYASGDSDFHQKSLTEISEHKSKHRIRVCSSGNILIETDHTGDLANSKHKNQTITKNGCLVNPWVIHCLQEQIKKMKKTVQVVGLNEFTKECILLENRVSKFKCPCILDIKMGTRQYWDDATLAKRQSHMAKVASSTSALLGMRISGIQLYDTESGHFICENKNYGRSLTMDGFHDALYNFFYDGKQLRYNIISSLLEKVRKLYDVIHSLNTFRFFTSSLLIIFSGKGQGSVLKNHHNSFTDIGKKPKKSSDVPNENGNIKKDQKHSVKVTTNKQACCENDDVSLSTDYTVSDCEEKKEKTLSPSVDLCMIDFAHSTQSTLPGTQVVHVGPDEGYLFGLKNLITHLEKLQRKGK